MRYYTFPPKGLYEKLDYKIDWSNKLPDGDTITGFNVTCDSSAVTVYDKTNSPTVTTFWLSGGKDNTTVTLSVTINTDMGRVVEIQVKLPIQ